MISQLTVFLENEEGRLAKCINAIADANINMQALFLADTKDFGVLRIFCDTPQAACDMLREKGFQSRLVDVVGVRVPDEPGALAKLMDYLDKNDIDIAYAHCFTAGEHAIDVLKVQDPALDVKLAAAGFDVVKPEELYALD